jgi:hypothetical protein
MFIMQWGMSILTVLTVTTTSVLAEVVCSNENTAVPATTPTTDFTLYSDGTVTHTRTGLMWMRCSLGWAWDGDRCNLYAGEPEPVYYNWQDALNAAQDINDSGGFAGHTDWRLPNKNELESIVEQRCWNPAINEALFSAPTLRPYWWSSSPNANPFDNNSAWGVHFRDGDVQYADKSDNHHVRLVRNAQ